MPVAFLYDPDAYFTDGRPLVGRRATGSAFLRAAIEGRGEEPLIFYGGRKDSILELADFVKVTDARAKVQWIPVNRTDLLKRVGVMYRPDPSLTRDARLRLSIGPAAYSLCGVTHTISSDRALDNLSKLVTEPLMPWDALICTSTTARGVVRSVVEDTLDHLRWRMKLSAPPLLPELPIIPLGVHARDFIASDAERRDARATLGLADDEIAILFAGRLSIATKAHPFQMYEGLRIAAEKTGKRLVLIQAGQAASEAAFNILRDAAEVHCPGVRSRFADGADPKLYAASFAGADIFLSLSDNVQETFGITPVEAMAAGLPVIVSDWNGYRDTVRDGIDGFRIATRGPRAGVGRDIALDYQMTQKYEVFCGSAALAVSMDMRQLVDGLTTLIDDADLRRRMGEAGRAHVLADYDWAIVYRQYRALWKELEARRRHSLDDPAQAKLIAAAPTAAPQHADPFRTFAGYSTHVIGPATMVEAAPGASRADYERLSTEPMFQLLGMDVEMIDRLLATAMGATPTIEQLAQTLDCAIDVAIDMSARLAKMNLLLIDRETDNN